MLESRLWILAFLFLTKVNHGFCYESSETESWTGRWFPGDSATMRPDFKEDHSGSIEMGVSKVDCDDAKTNLTLDWNNSFEDYVCLNPRSRYAPNETDESFIEFENIPKAYRAPHFCLDTPIEYSTRLPTFGPHRPLWPVYGEYQFLPKQRWLHSLEHGAIVALYHPCADMRQIYLLKKLVKSCLRRHVISPSRDLSKDRPLALIAWGVRFTMPAVYPNAIIQFIRERALKGPEQLPDEGQYDYMLKRKASIVSDFEDSKLCPNAMV